MSPYPPRATLLAAFFGTTLFTAACSSTPNDPPPALSGGDAAADAPVVGGVDDSNLIPCGPRRVLQTVCQQCHTQPPQNGAPFPLVTRSNVVRSTTDGQIRELMIEQIEAGRMPLNPVTIEAGDRAILLEWLRDGAVALDEPRSCAEEDDPMGSSRQ